jgi:hypothetical protein
MLLSDCKARGFWASKCIHRSIEAELSNYIIGLSDYIRKQVGECKEKLYHMIEERFEQYENKLIDEIRTKYA